MLSVVMSLEKVREDLRVHLLRVMEHRLAPLALSCDLV